MRRGIQEKGSAAPSPGGPPFSLLVQVAPLADLAQDRRWCRKYSSPVDVAWPFGTGGRGAARTGKDVLPRDVVLVALPVSTVALEHQSTVVNEELLLSPVLLLLGPLAIAELTAEVTVDVALPELVLVVVAVRVLVPVPVVTVLLEVTLPLV